MGSCHATIRANCTTFCLHLGTFWLEPPVKQTRQHSPLPLHTSDVRFEWTQKVTRDQLAMQLSSVLWVAIIVNQNDSAPPLWATLPFFFGWLHTCIHTCVCVHILVFWTLYLCSKNTETCTFPARTSQ